MNGTPLVSSPFRALRSRNFRLFFIGQAISLIGSWMTRLATSWLVYRLTESEFLLGLVSFAGQLPSMVLPPLAGVWLDRWDRRTVLIATQVLAMAAVAGAGGAHPERVRQHAVDRRAGAVPGPRSTRWRSRPASRSWCG